MNINVVTVHWKTDRWIDIQREYLLRHLGRPFRIFAWLNDIPQARTDGFHYVCREPVDSHAVKLNLLAEAIIRSPAADEDIIIFLDGDAFPIAEIGMFFGDLLSKHKLIAVQRLENDGDLQPHPCFCVTTAGFWRQIGGDWKAGYDWANTSGKLVTDVGGNLLRILRDQNIPWLPLLRSNRKEMHPVLFGIYDGKIYHHAAGFRPATTRADGRGLRAKILRKIASNAPRKYREPLKQKFFGKRLAEQNALSERIFQRIKTDPGFFRELM